jgi:N-acetylmuramoyl-L-alanine amidase
VRVVVAAALLNPAILALGIAMPAVQAQGIALRVIANGQDIPLAGTAIVHDGIVMAPYQGLFEPMGIRATWDSRTPSLTLVGPAGDEMQLRPNDPYATVNGEHRPIPIPLVTVLGRVLIPVQWVFETLGDVVVYDPREQMVTINGQITGVSWRGVNAGLEVMIDATAPLHATVTMLRGPDRLAVDIRGAVSKSPLQTFDVHEGSLATVRLGPAPGGTRIVFDLTAPIEYQIRAAQADRRVVIVLGSRLPAGPPGGKGGYTPSAQKITDVQYQHLEGGGRVTITATLPLHASEHILRNPDRIVLDVPDAVFIPVKKTVDVDDGMVIQIRAAQFQRNPNIVRIVLEVARPVPYAVHAGPDAGQALVDLGAAASGGPGSPSPGPPGPHGPAVVALDAGHGGSDPGAIGPTGVREKDVTLAIVQDLRALLARQHVDVVMIRESDVFVPLEDRAQIAARGGATLFVSIHANAAVDSNANGTQAFYATPQSAPLAAVVLDELSRAIGLAPRGASLARFKVLVDSDRIPAILVETAFITNPREEQMLRDPGMQQIIAQGILRGIVRFLAAPLPSPQ